MSTYFSGECHILLRLKGSPESIATYHQMIKGSDLDWPFVGRDIIRVCTKCFGVVWNAPRLCPADMKAAAKQLGIHCKVKRFAPVTHCKGKNLSFDYQNDIRQIPAEDAHRLFGFDGVKYFKDKYTPRIVTAVRQVIELPPVTPPPVIVVPNSPAHTEQLIAEVLAPPADELAEPSLAADELVSPDGSLIQFPDDGEWSNWKM